MTLHAVHAPDFDATCAECWSYTAADPLTVDEEPWRPDYFGDDEPDPVVTVAGWSALAVVIAIVAVIVLVRWPR